MGANFDTDGTCEAAATVRGTGDACTTVTSDELNLDALALNPPGQTQTSAVLENSVAIGAVAPGDRTASRDHRGVFRPRAGRCDSGAYEVASA